MCCSIYGSQIKPRKAQTLFKFYRLNDDIKHVTTLNYRLNDDFGVFVTSPLWDRRVVLRGGERIVSDRESAKLTENEITYGEIGNGIHAYTDREKAIKEASKRANMAGACPFIVVRLTGKPSQFVASGDNFHVVYNELIVEEVIFASDGINTTEK